MSLRVFVPVKQNSDLHGLHASKRVVWCLRCYDMLGSDRLVFTHTGLQERSRQKREQEVDDLKLDVGDSEDNLRNAWFVPCEGAVTSEAA